MRSLFLYVFILMFNCSALADKMPLLTDNTVTTTAEVLSRISSDAMATIKTKYSNLQKNYTPHFLTTGLDLDCHSGNSRAVEIGSQFAGLRINQEIKVLSHGLIQSDLNVTHSDCNGEIIFTEKIKTIGKMATKMSVQDAVKFVRTLEVLPGEKSRTYQIENESAEIVFSVASERLESDQGERIYSVIEVVGIKWAEFEQKDFSVNERSLFFRMNSGIFKLSSGSKYRMKYKNGETVLRTYWTDRRIEHLIDGNLSNQVNFDSILAEEAVGMTSRMLSEIMNEFISSLPYTKTVQVGISSSPFLRELELNYNRMATKKELEEVQKFLLKSIDDLKTGRFKAD